MAKVYKKAYVTTSLAGGPGRIYVYSDEYPTYADAASAASNDNAYQANSYGKESQPYYFYVIEEEVEDSADDLVDAIFAVHPGETLLHRGELVTAVKKLMSNGSLTVDL